MQASLFDVVPHPRARAADTIAALGPRPEQLARRSDPDTSTDAAGHIRVTEQMIQVLGAYRDGHELLDEQAYQRAGFSAAHHARQRCSDLRRAGLIGRVGRTARTVSGRSGHLCQITAAGRAVLQQVNAA